MLELEEKEEDKEEEEVEEEEEEEEEEEGKKGVGVLPQCQCSILPFSAMVTTISRASCLHELSSSVSAIIWGGRGGGHYKLKRSNTLSPSPLPLTFYMRKE